MSDGEMKPTFASTKDRLTYLASESQILASVLVLAAVGGVVAVVVWVDITIPSWLWSYLGGSALLMPMLLPSAYLIVKHLRERRMVRVWEVDPNPLGDGITGWDVPPELWEDRRRKEFPAFQLGGAYIVQDMDWLEDMGQIVVDGVYLSDLSPDKLLTLERYTEDIHSNLIQKHFELSAHRDRVGTMAAEMQEETVTAMAEARENGEMMDQTAVKDAWESAGKEMEDATDMEDLPDPEKYVDGAPSPGDDEEGDDL